MSIPDQEPLPTGDSQFREEAGHRLAAGDDPFAAADAIAARIRHGADEAERMRPAFSPLGLLLAIASAAGLAACLTLLYRGMAVIMETEGGFVATGGPYVIAHPAPDWVWIVPASIMAMMAFGFVGIVASTRGWGVNPMMLAWMALFISLGWNFLRLGLVDPPEGLQGAWGWVLSGVVFWIMGFAPALTVIRSARSAWQQIVDRQSFDGRTAWGAPTVTTTTPAYIAAQVLGVAAGITGGIALFSSLTRG